MRTPILKALLALGLAASFASPSAAASGANATPSDPRTPAHVYPLGTASEYNDVQAGQRAPDFAYEPLQGGEARLHDLLAQGNVLLVFGAGDAHLKALAAERPRLRRLGIVPVAVLDLRTKDARVAAARLQLDFPVIADPRRVIASQFGCLESATRAAAPAWFVLDTRARVRACDRFEWPAREWTALSADALGLPVGDAVLPASAGAR